MLGEKNPSLNLYLCQKWAPIEMNGKNCNLQHSKISQNNTTGGRFKSKFKQQLYY